MALKNLVSQWMFDGIKNIFKEGRFTDIQILVENKMFTCHKLVLASVSKYFDAMFSCGMRESTKGEVELHNVQSAVFEDIISFLYTGADIITCQNADELLRVSCMLQIECLQNRCEDFMFTRMTVDNCLGIWKIAKTHHCQKLLENTRPYILHNFENICKKDEFLDVEKGDIISWLKDDSLNITEEELVWNFIVSWVNVDWGVRRETFPELFECVRLPLIDLSTLLDDIDPNEFVRGDEACMRKVKEAVCYHAVPARRQSFSSSCFKYRKYMDREHFLTVLGRRENSNGERLTEFIGFDHRRSKWYCLPDMPYDIGEDFSSCLYGDDIFVSGGTIKPRSLLRFSAKLCKWVKRAQMTMGRCRHSMVACGQCLYAVAGHNYRPLRSIEEYDIDTDTWTQTGELLLPVDNVSAEVLNNKIFVFGGWQRFTEDAPTVQYFDIKTATCTQISDLPTPASFTRALQYDKTICIVTSQGELLTFGANYCMEIIGVVKDMDRSNFGLHKRNDDVFVLGGKCLSMDGKYTNTLCQDFLKFGAESGLGDMPETLPTAMEIFGCYRIALQKKYPLTECTEAFDEFVHIEGSSQS